MGTSNSVDELAKKMVSCGASIASNTEKGVKQMADVYKASALAEGSKDSGGDLIMSRWGRRKGGTKIGVGYELSGSGANFEALMRPRPAGIWATLERGAKPHLIVPGLTRRQGQALTLFSVMAGQGGNLDGYDIGALASSARGNRNNRGGRRRKPMLNVGGNVRPYVRHPGTSPKNTWSKAIKRGDKAAPLTMRRVQVFGLIKELGP
jgi:hypothetical protein